MSRAIVAKILAEIEKVCDRVVILKKGKVTEIVDMKEKNFDLVVLGNLHSNFVNIPMLFKYFTDYKIPVVIVLHDCFMYTGKCCHYTEDNCYKWQTECRNCKFFKKNNPSCANLPRSYA